jgi:hypothetical protein
MSTDIAVAPSATRMAQDIDEDDDINVDDIVIEEE